MTAILGLNAYHGDAAAALVVDGVLVNAAEEERFNRISHCAGFPDLAAAWCLEDAGIPPEDLDHVAVSRDPRANVGAELMRTVRHGASARYLQARLANAARPRDVGTALGAALDIDPANLRAQVHDVEHHQAHVASAFFVSPFESAAVLTVDGFGDFASTMLAVGNGARYEVLDRVLYPHSLGILYTAVTQWLGFLDYGDEGKVMGLAPYGDPEPHLRHMRDLVHEKGRLFELELDYFTHDEEGVDMIWDDHVPKIGRIYSEHLVDRFGPPRAPGGEVTRLHRDIAASLQRVLEEVYLHVLHGLQERTGETNITLAGGVALNAVANGRIRPETDFDGLYVQPAAGDSGTAIGCAYYVWNQVLGQPRSFVMDHAYTGPAYSDDACETAAVDAGFGVERLDDDALFPLVAERIDEGDVVGWFQGRMEFGPRALGNRSIVADPRRADMKEVLNARIKQREAFRPFAPSVVAAHVGDWFEQDYPSPFMVLVYRTRPEKRDLIPAVTHVDGTGRVESVERQVNPRYYRLIEEFERRTGVPMLLNTSFNENEPVVMTPEHALATFAKTKMDLLVLGNCIVRR